MYIRLAIHLCAYSAIVAGFCVWLFRMAQAPEAGDLFFEGQLIENVQLGLAVLAAVLFGAAAYRRPTLRAVLMVAAGLAVVAAVRESDLWLDRLLPYVGWQGAAALVLAVTGWLAWRRRQAVWDYLGPFLASPAGMLAWFGFIFVVLVAQILGQSEEWRALMGEAYTRNFKDTVEEMLEAIGYLMIFLAACETNLMPRGLFLPSSADEPSAAQSAVEEPHDAIP